MSKDFIKPPRLADKLFNWVCDNAFVEDLLGDLHEMFQENLKQKPVWRVKLNYWTSIFSLLFSYAIRKRKLASSFHTMSSGFSPGILRNYFVIAVRSLSRHRFFTIINVFGLAVGMSLSLLFISMISFITRYDDFHKKKDSIYRVISSTYDLQGDAAYASAPAPLAYRLRTEMPEVAEVVRISKTFSADATLGAEKISLSGYFVDPNFLQVFNFPLLNGNVIRALSDPRNLLIAEKTATKLFGTQEPIGKTISLGEFGDFHVAGILKDIPKNSHMQFEMLSSNPVLLETISTASEAWQTFQNSYVYLTIPDAAALGKVNEYLNRLGKTMYSKEAGFHATFELQSLNDIALGPELRNSIGPDWGLMSMTIFGILTAMILIPACFNYTNISISRALKRMKEIGVRKVMGGQQNQIFVQFILETTITTLLALGLSYYLFAVGRHEFLSMIVGGGDYLDLTPDTQTLFYFVAFAVLVGFAAGAVPALYFSRLKPVEALKGKVAERRHSSFSLRKVLIVTQFAISIGFIMGVVIMVSQYRYTLNHDFGFDKENILNVELQGANPELFSNEASKIAGVHSVSLASGILGTSSVSTTWLTKDSHSDSMEVYQMFVDHNFLPNLKLTLQAGNNFSENGLANRGSVIVNEEFLKQFKISSPIDAINETVHFTDGSEGTIVGVVKNFHYQPFNRPIESFFFRYDPKHYTVAQIKLGTSDMFATVNDIEAVWETIHGDRFFAAKFFEDEMEAAYSMYFVMIKICGFLGLLAITVSCLGLLGMVVFTIENRVKEVGIRKAMGASVVGMVLLLSKDFLKLMAIAACVATPVAFLFFDKIVLRNEYYRVDVGILEIGISFLIMLFLGLGSILSQTVRAARANPIDALRYE